MEDAIRPDEAGALRQESPLTAAAEESAEAIDAKTPTPPKTLSKTPAFQAMHAARYRRQELIKAIEKTSGRQLICYVAGLKSEISRDDVLFLVDLLHNIRPNEDLDFLLHTPGGDIDAAEKLIKMVRNKVGTATLRIVIPDFAKSSGTLIALGADYIVMSDSSELGPIDPQIVMSDGDGNRMVTPILSYLGAYEEQRKALKDNPNDVAAQLMLNKLDPTRAKLFETALLRARSIAEEQLKYGMFRSKSGNFTAIAGALLNPQKYLSHGQMIGADDAIDIGLEVEYLEMTDELWQRYWQLYCHQRLEILDKHKLFESSYASLNFEAGA